MGHLTSFSASRGGNSPYFSQNTRMLSDSRGVPKTSILTLDFARFVNPFLKVFGLWVLVVWVFGLFTSSLFDRRDSDKRVKINISLLSGFCLWTLHEKSTDLNLLFFGGPSFRDTAWDRALSTKLWKAWWLVTLRVRCIIIQIVSDMNLVDYPMTTLRKGERY